MKDSIFPLYVEDWVHLRQSDSQIFLGVVGQYCIHQKLRNEKILIVREFQGTAINNKKRERKGHKGWISPPPLRTIGLRALGYLLKLNPNLATFG